MKKVLYVLGIAVIGIAFGLAISVTFSEKYALTSLLLGSALFFTVYFLLRRLASPQWPRSWLIFGAITSCCSVLAFVWYWYGAMNHNWWLPPTLQVVQLFSLVDGESAYDAQASNLFLTLLAFASLILVACHLTIHSSRPPGSGNS
jgi:hypothetical protein